MNVGLVPHNTARSVKYFCSGYHFQKFVLDVFLYSIQSGSMKCLRK